jgi:hypothetical protein
VTIRSAAARAVGGLKRFLFAPAWSDRHRTRMRTRPVASSRPNGWTYTDTPAGSADTERNGPGGKFGRDSALRPG